jgi:hypothetical protein
MTCRCKAQFCYICGLRWRTCACTDAQLATIQQQAVTRRVDENIRTARARAEEEEERIVLQMVADFERQEAERLAREAEVQRQAEEEARHHREEERIAAVNLRFHSLNTELEILHNVQRVLMFERHELEAELLSKDRQDALDMLAIRHPTELQVLKNESQSRISNVEARFNADYQTRLAEERRIEDDYVDQLREFWKGKPGGEFKVRESRNELIQDQDREYKNWDAWQRRQLQDIVEVERRKIEGLRGKQENEVKVVEGRSRCEKGEWRRKIIAEERWVKEIGSVRREMLREMEQEANAT